MKHSFVNSLLGGVLLLLDSTSGQLSLDIKRPPTLPLSELTKRDAESVDLLNTLQWGGTYRASFKVGTPGHNTSTCLETSNENYGPCSFGGFDAEQSESYEETDETFDLDLGTDTDGNDVYAQGVQFLDQIALGDMTITNLTMGYATNLTNGDVPQVSLLYDEDYDAKNKSFIYQAWSQGHIPTLGYSIWLGPQSEDHGRLNLGAIDTSKYSGQLYSFDTISTVIRAPLTSLSASSSTGTDDLASFLPTEVTLLLGSALSRLPQDLAYEIWNVAGVTGIHRGYLPLIPCSRRESEGYFTLGFGGDEGVGVNMTMRELVLDEGTWDPDLFPASPDGEPQCVFAITNETSPFSYMLTESFFRSAYVAVDLHNSKVAIAPSKINADPEQSEIVAFGGNGAPIPSATEVQGVPDLSSDVASEPSISNWQDTGKTYAAAEGFASLTTTGGNSSDGGENGDDSSLSVGAKAGIGAGVGVGALLIGAGAFFFWRRKRRGKASSAAYSPATTDAYTGYDGGKPELSGTSVPVDTATLQIPPGYKSELEGYSPQAAPVEIDGHERPIEADSTNRRD